MMAPLVIFMSIKLYYIYAYVGPILECKLLES